MLEGEYLCGVQDPGQEIDDLWIVFGTDDVVDLKLVVGHGGGMAVELKSLSVQAEQIFPSAYVVHPNISVAFVAHIMLRDAGNVGYWEVDVVRFLGSVSGQGSEVVDVGTDGLRYVKNSLFMGSA